ncbi:MAG: MATE family efflux transporter [Treponema sp.]|nr:MATE family efflux transporter [Treponema sp.]
MTKDMTEGSPLNHIVQFSIPLLLGNVFQQTYNMMDAAIVGKVLGTGALAAVGSSSSMTFLVLGFCFGLCSGFAIPVAQRFGARQFRDMRQYIFIALVSTAVFAIAVTAVCAALCPHILRMLATPPDIFDDAWRYLIVVFLGIPFTMLYNLLSGILRAVGDSRTPFYFLVLAALLNIALDLCFILVFHWGVAGAALATVVSQAASGLLCILLILKKFEVLHVRSEERVWSGEKFRLLLVMGIPMGLQFSITAIGSIVMQTANNRLGSVYVSAFTAGSRIKQLGISPFDAVGSAVTMFASQNYGACKMDRVKQGLKEGIALSLLVALVVCPVFIVFSRQLSLLFIPKTETVVLAAASRYVRCMGCFFWLIAFLQILRPTTQGLGFSNRAIFSGVFEMAARCTVSFAFVPLFGFSAICFADQSAWVCAVAYIFPTCVWCVRRREKELSSRPA